MSTASSSQPAPAGSKGTHLSANLSSNNPFRNRAASPSNVDVAAHSSLSTSPFDDPPKRPLSRNPFLDQPAPLRSPGAMSANSDSKSLSAEEIFNSLTLEGNGSDLKLSPASQGRPSGRPPGPTSNQSSEGKRPASSKHRPTKSQEEALRARRQNQGSKIPSSSQSPQRKPYRRQRRNSDSSILDFDTKSITADEKKMIEKRREREKQRREGRDGKERGRSSRPSRKLDIIDQLDATSVYGSGFHHDGPFDALNPHRNRQNARRAPMQAFPKDSLNNSIGGSGPLRQQADHSTFMGNTEEAFRDYARSGRVNNGQESSAAPSRDPAIFDPVARGQMIHGDESYGLGTSTFLEGTPAARTAIARRHAEQAQAALDGGLQRKKSLAHRIRHMNKGPRDPSVSADGQYGRPSPDPTPPPGGTTSEYNPFFAEYGKGEDKITVGSRDGALSPGSPPPIVRRGSGAALERRATTDATSPADDGPAKPTGLLGRMKSLKGGRRPRNVEAANNPPLNQG